MLHTTPIKVLPLGTCLIDALAQDLKGRAALDIKRTLVLLPTRRLQLHLSSALCVAAGGAAWLPSLQTWDQFLSTLMIDLQEQSTELVMVSEVAELIMTQLLSDSLKAGLATNLNPRHAHELLHLLKELWRHGVRDSAKDSMKVWLERQWHLSEKGQRQILDRLDAVFDQLNTFETQLANTWGMELPERHTARGLQHVEEAIDRGSLRLPATRIVIAGITTLPLIQGAFLSKLAKVNGVEIWLDQVWQDLSVDAPLRRLHQWVGSDKQLQFERETRPPLNVKALHSCQDPLHECAVALSRAAECHRAGIPWHRIEIAVPDEAMYASTFTLLCENLNIPCNIPLARPWKSTRMGQWMGIYEQWLQRGSTDGLLHVLSHPFTKVVVTPHLPHPQLFSKQEPEWEAWLADAPHQMLRRAQFNRALEDSKLDQDTKDNLSAAWSFLAGDLLKPRDLLGWWCKDILPPLHESLGSKRFSEQSAFDAVKEAAAVLQRFGDALTAGVNKTAEFLQILVHLAQASSPRDTGEPLSGLQIISVTEARYVPCDVLIIVGLAEGTFPHRLPQDTLIGNSLKRAAGMPGWSQLEALEETTFHLLCSRVAHVELTWPEAIAETAAIRSRWVERLIATGVTVTPADQRPLLKALGHFELASVPMQSPEEGVVLDADLEDLLSSVSARSLKALMICPYQFLLQKRGIRSIRLRTEGDLRDIGQSLHKVIELTCSGSFDQSFKIPVPWLWRRDFSSTDDVCTWSLQRLKFFSDRLLNQDMKDNPLIVEIIHSGWPALAESWSNLWTAGWNPADAKVEWRIRDLDSDTPLSLTIGERLVQVTGVIDMIHLAPSGQWCVIDFKTNQEPPMSSIRKGFEPQLLLYALCMNRNPQLKESNENQEEKGVIAYWSLRQGSFVEIARGSHIDDGITKIIGKPRASLPELLTDFRNQWAERMKSVERSSRFYADTRQCGHCDFQDVCRKNDPRFERLLSSQGSRP